VEATLDAGEGGIAEVVPLAPGAGPNSSGAFLPRFRLHWPPSPSGACPGGHLLLRVPATHRGAGSPRHQ
jgi:hypothetical protein